MARPSVCFLTLNSPMEGVGRSQVLPVLEQVSRRGWDCTLVSFRKDGEPRDLPNESRAGSNIRHVSLGFGAPGPWAGVARIGHLTRSLPSADVYHCRDLLAFTAAHMRRKSPLIWDVRSLWAEQRAAAGTLSRRSPAFWTLNRLEGHASRTAAGMVTLTAACAEELLQRYGGVPSRRRVIPTVTDLDHFRSGAPPPSNPLRVCLSGTFGANYDMELAGAFISSLKREHGSRVETIWTSGPGVAVLPSGRIPSPLTQASTDYADMPEVISECHFGLVPIRLDTGVSATAMMPTKVGEFWASGRPIVVTRGVGDLDRIISQHRVGIILDSADPEELRARARDLLDLLSDPELANRCRSVAEEYFDLAKGVDELVSLYESLL